MSPGTLNELLFSLPHVEESTPFGPDVFVQKVGGKMFALYSMNEGAIRLNLKCDPDRAVDLREKYEAILPGYHMNKRHWNSLILDETLPVALVRELIMHSYDLVFGSLPRKVRETMKPKD